MLPELFERAARRGRRAAWSTARTRALAGRDGDALGEATDEDWDTEYLGLKMAVKIVDSLEEAIDHVNRHGTGHSEAIVTADERRRRARSRAASTPPACT